MKISKKDLLYLVEQKLNEMPMEFPRSLNVRRPNPNYDPNREENDENPKSIEVEVPFNERPNVDIQNKLQRQDTPIKKVPLPSGQGNQNFQEMLASETYQEIIRRVKEATGIDANNLLTIMMNAVHEVDSAEMEHKEELERLAAESVFNLYKIPQDSVNIFVKLISISGRRGIPTDDFLHKQDNENPEAPEVGDENPQSMNVNDIDDMEVEQDYVSKLENFDLERAKRRLINAMTQGAAHSAYNLYKYVADRIRQIVPETPSGTDIMDLYATMMSINDTNYWHMSDQQVVALQSSIAGKADVKFPSDGEEGGDEGGDDEEEGGDDDGGQENNVDTLGNEIDLSKPQVYVYGINFPVLFHETMKGIQKVIAGHGSTFPGYDSSNPRHVDFIERVKQYEDVLEYEMWDLRLGPSIWQRYRLAHPTEVIDPDQKIELQHWVQSYIYKLPARKFLSLMKEIIAGTPKAKQIIVTLVSSIEKMLADEDYQDAIAKYEEELDDIDDETSDDDLLNLLKNIPGVRLSDEDDENEEDEDDELPNGTR